MNDILSKHTSNIFSKTDGLQVESKATLDVQSKADINVESELKTEKEAFLYTSKRNVSMMFAKYL